MERFDLQQRFGSGWISVRSGSYTGWMESLVETGELDKSQPFRCYDGALGRVVSRWDPIAERWQEVSGSADEFKEWLRERMSDFFGVTEDDSAFKDESIDLGDMWREIEDEDELMDVGVKTVCDHEVHEFFFSGGEEGKRWVLSSRFELGRDGEKVWPNPIFNMVKRSEEDVQIVINRLVRRASEFADLMR